MEPPSKRLKVETVLPKDIQSTGSLELESSFLRDIRPKLDVVDRIQAQGDIQLPTIVVVGDHSSGKRSVLESLTGIMLPQGQGIAARVPLVLRLQSCGSNSDSIIKMDYGDVKDQVIDGEDCIEAAFNSATTALAGFNKALRDNPIQLLIRKPSALDLTMVDLPGLLNAPGRVLPKDMYEHISHMIMEYITPKENIIMNVLSAQDDFNSSKSIRHCKSIRMSQGIDREGKRTLVVITKVDKAPEGLLEKVRADVTSISLDFVCVRNCTDKDDSIAIARVREKELFKSHPALRELLREKELFESHPALRELDGSMVGIPALARRLTAIQSYMVKGCLRRIEKQLHEALNGCNLQLNGFSKGVESSSDARVLFYQISNRVFTLLSQIVREGNFTEFPDENYLPYPARLQRLFEIFAAQLQVAGTKFKQKSKTFEIEELIDDHQGVTLPDFLPHPVLRFLMKQQIKGITRACTGLVEEAFEHATEVVLHIGTACGHGYPRLVKLYKQIATDTLEEAKKSTMLFVENMLEKENSMIFTTNGYYIAKIEKMNAALRKVQRDEDGHVTPQFTQSGAKLPAPYVSLGDTDKISLDELDNMDRTFEDAWRMKVSAAAYWKVVQKRLADEIPMEIKFALQRAIINTIHKKMMNHPWSAGGDVDMLALMEEDARIASNRSSLQRRVDALKDCLPLLSGVMH